MHLESGQHCIAPHKILCAASSFPNQGNRFLFLSIGSPCSLVAHSSSLIQFEWLKNDKFTQREESMYWGIQILCKLIWFCMYAFSNLEWTVLFEKSALRSNFFCGESKLGSMKIRCIAWHHCAASFPCWICHNLHSGNEVVLIFLDGVAGSNVIIKI